VAAAAFYDLEGTLVSTNLVHTLGFYAKNQQGLFRTFKKSASTLLSIPIFAVTDQYSRKVFNDLFFKRYKGESEDRLRFFAEELFEDVLKPAIFPGAFELIEKSRSLGLRQVVVTGALDGYG
jgi:phosphoserine phosphatase